MRLGCRPGTCPEDSGQSPSPPWSMAVCRVRVEGVSESVTLASRPLGDSPGCLAGCGELHSCWGCPGCPGPPPASLCHILVLRQTDSFAHWSSRAGGAAVKTNTRPLTGGLWAVFWGLPGPRTPGHSGCPGLNPGRGGWACPFAAWVWASPAPWVFFTKAVLRRLSAGLARSPSPLTGCDCLQPNLERKYLEKGLSSAESALGALGVVLGLPSETPRVGEAGHGRGWGGRGPSPRLRAVRTACGISDWVSQRGRNHVHTGTGTILSEGRQQTQTAVGVHGLSEHSLLSLAGAEHPGPGVHGVGL